MKTSEQIDQIAVAIAKAQPGVKNAVASSDNPFFKSKYADLETVKAACFAAYNAQDIAILQAPVTADGRVGVVTRLVHKSGQWIESELLLPVSKQDPQAYGSAITYARRYSLAAMAGVATADDDGNAATHTAPPKQPAAPKAAPAPEPPPPPATETNALSDEDLAGTVIPFGRATKGKKIAELEMGMLQKIADYDMNLSAEGQACRARVQEYLKRAKEAIK